jgi:hypothetical protein
MRLAQLRKMRAVSLGLRFTIKLYLLMMLYFTVRALTQVNLRGAIRAGLLGTGGEVALHPRR